MPVNRPARYVVLACGILLLAALPAAVPASAAGGALRRLQSDATRQLALAGPHDGAWAYDVTTGRPLLSVRSSVPRPPASVEKLYTSTTLLELLGPQARLSTQVLGQGHMGPGGVWEGTLYLRGEGDPTFGESGFIRSVYSGTGASVQSLARALHAHGIARVTGGIRGDESFLDPLRGEPSSNYAPDPFLEGTLSGLAFDRGATGSIGGAHAPAAYAASRLAAALRSLGVHVEGSTSGAAPTPAGSVPLATAPSPTIAQLLGLMLPPSDNFFAETLIKDLGARFGGAGTTAAGAGVVLRTIAQHFGLHPHIVDGSGLSESDRTSPAQIGSLLVAMAGSPLGTVLRSAMAVAGHSGTLAGRMRGTPAAGRCHAKTGTLTGVSNLAGYCTTASGHLVAFAVFTDGISIEAAHTFQDRVAIDIAGSAITPEEEGVPAAPAPPAGSGSGGAPPASGTPVSSATRASGGAAASLR